MQATKLRSVDPATQQKAYEHWKSVIAQLDKISAAELSDEERINLECYRYQIETQLDQLETAPVPLPVLEEHPEAWIKGGGIGPYPSMEN